MMVLGNGKKLIICFDKIRFKLMLRMNLDGFAKIRLKLVLRMNLDGFLVNFRLALVIARGVENFTLWMGSCV